VFSCSSYLYSPLLYMYEYVMANVFIYYCLLFVSLCLFASLCLFVSICLFQLFVSICLFVCLFVYYPLRESCKMAIYPQDNIFVATFWVARVFLL